MPQQIQVKIQIKDWNSLTIQDCINLVSLKIPAKLRELYMSTTPEIYTSSMNAFNDKDYLLFSKYYGDVLKIMISDFGEFESVDNLQWHERLDIYLNYCEDIIRSLFLGSEPTYKPKGLKSFKFEGEEYFIPDSLILFEREIPGANETALSFTEGAAMYDAMLEMKENGIDKMPYFIAVYCRKKDEPYSEEIVLKRAEKFKKLPMFVAWEVFFYIRKSLKGSWTNMMEYLKATGVRLRHLKNRG